MATNIQFTSIPSKRLSASINAASTTIQLGDILGWNGSNLTSSDLGDKLYAVLRNDTNTLMEIIELDPTTIASASITVLKRGLKFNGDLTTEVTANKLTWVKNETIVELGSHPAQLLNYTVRTYGDQTINDTKTFVTFPQKSGSTTPTGASELATKFYVDSVVGGTALYDQNVVTGVAGETLAAGKLVYLKTADGRWWLCDADTASTVDAVKIGFAQATATAGNSINVVIGGIDKNQSGLTAGVTYYASNTAGSISSSAGTNEKIIGKALTTTSIILDTNFAVIPTAGQAQALVGTGTPSSSNKFTTQDYTQFLPSGAITMYAGSSAPTGYLLCDGTSYLRATYANLFTAIGTTYGSADGTHFNVPDLRGRVPVGVGTGTGGGASGTGAPTGGSALTAVSLATWKGEETHVLTTAEMPAHTHNVQIYTAANDSTRVGGLGATPGSTQATSSAGSDGAHNNIQPVMGVNFIIKT